MNSNPTDAPPELLPCPFCGGEAEFAVSKGSRGYPDMWDVCCEECDASTDAFPEKEQAVERWNTRATSTAERVEELEAGLRDAIILTADWAEYASDYFKEKHDLAGDLQRLNELLDPAKGTKG